jgi:hypothetical protein
MFRSGFLKIFSWRGAPLRLHWTIPVGALVFGRFQWVPGFWTAFLLLVVIHEMGHAFLVRRFGLRLLSVDVHGLGGQCNWSGEPTAMQRSIIAWGGVGAQLVLLLLTSWAAWAWGPDKGVFAREMVMAFTTTNLWLMAINLMPIAPLDGAEAWKMLPLLRARWRRRKKFKGKEKEAMKKANAIQEELARLHGIDAEVHAGSNEGAQEVADLLGKISKDINEAGPVE